MVDGQRRIVFCGHSGAGKDEAAQYLCARYEGLTYGRSVSYYVAEELASTIGVPVEVLRGPDRHKYRQDFFDFANEVRWRAPEHFLAKAFAHGNVITGIRDPREITCGRWDGEIIQFIWIARDVPDDPTMAYLPEGMCDITISNRTSLMAFHQKLDRWAQFSGFKRLDKVTSEQ